MPSLGRGFQQHPPSQQLTQELERKTTRDREEPNNTVNPQHTVDTARPDHNSRTSGGRS